MKIDYSNLRATNIILSSGSLASANFSAAREMVASPSVIVTLSPAAQRAQDAQNKKFEDIQNALQRLRSMPSPRILAKREAAAKAMRLKARIDMLKQMLIGASPKIAKGIAAQIKSIASELSSLAKAGSNQPDAGTVATNSAGLVASVNASNIEQSASSAVSDAVPVPAEGADPQTKPETAQAPAVSSAQDGEKIQTDGRQPQSQKGDNAENDINAALKKAIEEAKSTLKSLIAMLKAILGVHNKDVDDGDHILAGMDQSQGETGIQATSMDIGGAEASVPSGDPTGDVAVPA